MKFDNVTNRIKNLTYGLSEKCDSTKVAQQVFSSLYDNITTQEIDTLSAEICIGMITSDPDYETLATRIVASNIHKVCPNNFHLAMRKLHKAGVVTDQVVEVAQQVKGVIDTDRDFDFGYFGLKTLEKSYLQRVDGKLVETPQYMFMRVSIGIHGDDINSVIETYDMMSRGLFIHATPTLFNSGVRRIRLMVSTEPSPSVRKSVNGRVVLGCTSMIFVQTSLGFEVQTVNPMVLSQCSASSTQRHAM